MIAGGSPETQRSDYGAANSCFSGELQVKSPPSDGARRVCQTLSEPAACRAVVELRYHSARGIRECLVTYLVHPTSTKSAVLLLLSPTHIRQLRTQPFVS